MFGPVPISVGVVISDRHFFGVSASFVAVFVGGREMDGGFLETVTGPSGKALGGQLVGG